MAAISALALMFRIPSLPRAAGIGFLSVFSLLLMPKYEHMLFFGGIAYYLYATLRVPRGWRLLLVGVEPAHGHEPAASHAWPPAAA